MGMDLFDFEVGKLNQDILRCYCKYSSLPEHWFGIQIIINYKCTFILTPI